MSHGTSTACLAFSAWSAGHTSYSDHDVVDFPYQHLDAGGAWNGTTFTAPVAGLYYFSLSFVRDSGYFGGTWDDVYLYLVKNNVDVGYAWAGESDSNDPAWKRMTGAYSVALELMAGDVVKAASGGDGGFNRHLIRVDFTGFLVQPTALQGDIGFSAFQPSHTSYSDHDVIDFPTELTDAANNFNGTTFTAPVMGLYLFTLGFVRDSYYQNGTADDVYMYLQRGGVDVGFAWAGESDLGDPAARRMTGAYTVALRLLPGEVIRAVSAGDGGFQRHMMNLSFTGVLLQTEPMPGYPAFSASTSGHTSYSDHDVVDFQAELTDVSGDFATPTFTAPISGVYFFNIGIVRDSAYFGGTWDDVYVHLVRNNVDVGMAWAGESDSNEVSAKRMTGAYSVSLYLFAGDVVKAASAGDGGFNRHIIKAEMTGVLVGACPPEDTQGFVFCAGDGSGTTACPCSNFGAAGHGCANSTSAAGALLANTGIASVSSDTLVLTGSEIPGPALFFQANGLSSNPIVYGDGLLCATTGIRRLGVAFPVGGTAAFPGGALPIPISIAGAPIQGGDMKHYQVWYRNSAAYCAPATFNTSNGVSLTWAP